MHPLSLHIDTTAVQYANDCQPPGVYDDVQRLLRSNPYYHLVDEASAPLGLDAPALVTASGDAALAAAGSGRHVLLLSPFATEAGVREALAATKRCRAALPQRHMPSFSEVLRALQSGKLGLPGLLRTHRWHPAAGDGEIACSLMAAELDLALLLFDAEPSDVYATRHDGLFHLHLGFSSSEPADEGDEADGPIGSCTPAGETSGMALLHIDTAAPDDQYYTLSLIGSTGAVHVDDHRNQHLLFTRNGRSAFHSSETHLGLANAIQSFAEGIWDENGQGAELGSGWLDVERALTLLDRAKRSATLKQALSHS